MTNCYLYPNSYLYPPALRGSHEIALSFEGDGGGCLTCRVARGFFTRLRGMLGAGPDKWDRRCLVFFSCSSIHTLGMRFDLDVAFLGRDGSVLRSARGVKPGRFLAVPGATAVVERVSDFAPWPAEGDLVWFSDIGEVRQDRLALQG